MTRCMRTSGLQVHHKRRDGGNRLDNTQVLCEACHQETGTFGEPGQSPPDFTPLVKKLAIMQAGNRCECVSPRGCH